MAGITRADNRLGRDFDNPGAGMQGNITALYVTGCMLGSIICYFVGERFSRKTMMIVGGTIMSVGVAILGTLFTVAQLIGAELVYSTSLSKRVFTSKHPRCITIPPGDGEDFRGSNIILYRLRHQQLLVILSVAVPALFPGGGAFAVLLIVQVVGLPEPPRWLVAHDRHEEARSVSHLVVHHRSRT